MRTKIRNLMLVASDQLEEIVTGLLTFVIQCAMFLLICLTELLLVLAGVHDSDPWDPDSEETPLDQEEE